MEVDFIVQDSFALVRPQWKLVVDLQEATHAFSEAVAVNYKQQTQEKAVEHEDDVEESASDDDMERDMLPDVEDEVSSGEEHEVIAFPAL